MSSDQTNRSNSKTSQSSIKDSSSSKKSIFSVFKTSKPSEQSSQSSSSTKMPSEFSVSGGHSQTWNYPASHKSSSASAFDAASSVEAGSSTSSSISRALGKAKSKFSRDGSEVLADDENDFMKQKEKAVRKQQREDDYRRLGLDQKVKHGYSGTGSFNSM